MDGSLNPHVWLDASGDIFRHNIVWTTYRPARMYHPPWGEELDYNLLYQAGGTNAPATRLQQQSGRDEHSIAADPEFIDPGAGDYRVKPGSPALGLGFVNFPMDQFGVQKPELKAIARTPVLPGEQPAANAAPSRDLTPQDWLGARVRNIADEGEMSAFGLPAVTGVVVLEVSDQSPPARAGLQKSDVILSVNGDRTASVVGLLRQVPGLAAGQTFRLGIARNQKHLFLMLTP